MIDSLKKTLLAGIGAAVVTKEKAEAALGDFVKQGKVTAADAKKMAEKLAADGREEFDQASEQLGTKLKELLARINGETEARIKALEARVTALEGKSSGRSRKS